MHGSAGSTRRRRIILAEFLIGAVVCIGLGLWALSPGGMAATLFGLWLIGCGINYVPLSLHALSLSRPGALDAELRGVDIRSELRYYTRTQVWVFVPLAIVVLALLQRDRQP